MMWRGAAVLLVLHTAVVGVEGLCTDGDYGDWTQAKVWESVVKTTAGSLKSGKLKLGQQQQGSLEVRMNLFDFGWVGSQATIKVLGAQGKQCASLQVKRTAIAAFSARGDAGKEESIRPGSAAAVNFEVKLVVEWGSGTAVWTLGTSAEFSVDAAVFFAADACGQGFETVDFKDSGAIGVKVACDAPAGGQCAVDDELRTQQPFDKKPVGGNANRERRTIQLVGNTLGTVGEWDVELRSLLRSLPGSPNNAAAPALNGVSELRLNKGTEVWVLYLGVSRDGLDGRPSTAGKVLVKLVGEGGVECATLTGDTGKKEWTVAGPQSTTLTYTDNTQAELLPVTSFGEPKRRRVEVRMEWKETGQPQWSLYIGGKKRVTKRTDVKKQCPGGVRSIKLLGEGVLYDNVQLTCSSNNDVLKPTSAWGDPHYTDAFGTKFDFMGVPQVPYVLYEDARVIVAGVVYRCNPQNAAVTCLKSVRFSSPNAVETVDVTAGVSGRVEVRGESWCGQVAEVGSWAVVDTRRAAAGLVKVTVRDAAADEDLVEFVVSANLWLGTYHVNVEAKPLPALSPLGVGGLLFGTGSRWAELRETMRKGGKRVVVPNDLVAVAANRLCMCASAAERELGFCADTTGHAHAGAVQQQGAGGAVLSVPTAEEGLARCGATGVDPSWARGCCAKLEKGSAVAHAQCVRDHCETGGGGACVAGTERVVAFEDRTGDVPLELCGAGRPNVVQNAETLACDTCRSGWYPAPPEAGACTVECDAEKTCGGSGAECTPTGMCRCPGGTVVRGRCPVAPTECTGNAECARGSWCRPAVLHAGAGGCDESLWRCTTLRSKGEQCGSTSPDRCRHELCDTGLVCDPAAGVCAVPLPPLPTRCGYIGCLKKEASLPLQPRQVTTLDACEALCRASGAVLYGVERGTRCYCDGGGAGSLLVLPETTRGDCNTPCPGNEAEMCGGPTGMSVFFMC